MFLVVSLATSQVACVGRSAVPVPDLVPLHPAEHRQVLHDGTTEGRLLHIKTKQYQREPSGNLAQNLTTEIWLGASPDGTFVTAVAKAWFPDGPVTMDMLGVYGRHTLPKWLEQSWNIAKTAEQAGAEFKGRGNLHGWESLVYEWSSGTEVQKLEIVEDAPLIARESPLELDQ